MIRRTLNIRVLTQGPATHLVLIILVLDLREVLRHVGQRVAVRSQAHADALESLGQSRRQLLKLLGGRSGRLVVPDHHFAAVEDLIVEHGDGLDGLDRMTVFDDPVTPRLSVLVLVQLGVTDPPGEAENFLQLALADVVGEVGHEQPRVQRPVDVERAEELRREAVRVAGAGEGRPAVSVPVAVPVPPRRPVSVAVTVPPVALGDPAVAVPRGVRVLLDHQLPPLEVELVHLVHRLAREVGRGELEDTATARLIALVIEHVNW